MDVYLYTDFHGAFAFTPACPDEVFVAQAVMEPSEANYRFWDRVRSFNDQSVLRQPPPRAIVVARIDYPTHGTSAPVLHITEVISMEAGNWEAIAKAFPNSGFVP